MYILLMAAPNEPANVWTDEMIERLGTRADLSNKNGHPTGLVSFADGKRALKLRRFVTRCPKCDKTINARWEPADEVFHFDCTRKVPECNYSTTLNSDSYRELLESMTDANDKPIPGKPAVLPL
jgi:hypothetical protein